MWFSECSTETSAWVWIRDLRISQQSAAASYLSGTKIELDHQPKAAPCKTLFIMSTVAVCMTSIIKLSKSIETWRLLKRSYPITQSTKPTWSTRMLPRNGNYKFRRLYSDRRQRNSGSWSSTCRHPRLLAQLEKCKCRGQMGWIWWMGVVPPSPGSLYSLYCIYWYIMVYTSPFMDWWPSPNTWQSNVI